MSSLNERQRQFAENYASSGNGTMSAIRAGYSERTAAEQASRLIRNRKVVEYLNKLRAESSNGKIASASEIQETWSSLMRDSSKPAAARLRAGELLLKATGGFVPEDEELPPEPKPDVLLVFPWNGRGGPPNAVQYHGAVSPLLDDDGERPGTDVYEVLDLLDKKQMERFWAWEAQSEYDENENDTQEG